MKMYALWIVGVAMLLLTGIPALAVAAAAAPAPAPAVQKAALPPEYVELNLSADQQTQVLAKLQAMKTGLSNWDQQHHDQWSKLQADAKGTDKEAAAKSHVQMDALMAEKAKLESSLKKDVLMVLTPDQQQTFAGLQIYHQNRFAALVKDLGLTPDQDAKLKAATKAYAVGKTQWELQNGEKSAMLQKQINDAQKQINDARAAQQALQASKDKLDADEVTAVNAALTPDQKITWRADGWQKRLEGMYGKAKLTTDQLAKIKTMCLQASKDQQAPTNILRGAGEMPKKLQDDVFQQVLTADQRTALTAK